MVVMMSRNTRCCLRAGSDAWCFCQGVGEAGMKGPDEGGSNVSCYAGVYRPNAVSLGGV